MPEDDGELVARDERAADLRRGDFGDVHRADGRGESDADAADDAVDVERHQQRERCLAVGQDACSRATTSRRPRRKMSTAAMTSERLRPKREASRPEIAPPMTQPISALEAVKPCIHDV